MAPPLPSPSFSNLSDSSSSQLDFTSFNAQRLEEEARRRLTDFTNPDIQFLQFVVSNMSQSTDLKMQNVAIKILEEIKEQKDCWKIVQPILNSSTQHDTIFFALLLLQQMVQNNWRSLSIDDRIFLNSFVKKMIDESLEGQTSSNSLLVLKKLNSVIVEVAKKEYPNNWPTFIQELTAIDQFQQDNALLRLTNNLRTIRLFATDIFSFSRGKIQHNRLKCIKDVLRQDFTTHVFNLIQETIKNLDNKDVIREALGCLEAFSANINLIVFYDAQFLQSICCKKYLEDCSYSSRLLTFLSTIVVRNDQTLSTIISAEDFENKVKQLFIQIIEIIMEILPFDIDLETVYNQMSGNEQDFIHGLGQFIAKILSSKPQFFSNSDKEIFPTTMAALKYMIQICHIKDGYYFQYHSHFWKVFTESVQNYEEYEEIIRAFLLGFSVSMAKPEEILIRQDDAGNIVREELKDTQQIQKYQEMSKSLQNLLISQHFKNAVLETIFELLTKQTGTWAPGVSVWNQMPPENSNSRGALNTNWTYKKISSISYAIGSCSGVISVDDESHFAVLVLKELLFMNEQLSKPEEKSVVATCIMYIIGQYPRFLRDNEKFCRTVIMKLFEFMHETFVGVKDMSCDTFAKIVSKCRKMFCKNSYHSKPFIFEIIEQIPTIIDSLSNHQKLSFYKSIAILCAEYKLNEDAGISSKFDPCESILRHPYLENIQNFVDQVSSGNQMAIIDCYSDSQVLNRLAFSLTTIYTFYEIVSFPLEFVRIIVPLLEILYLQCNNIIQMENCDEMLKAVLPHLQHLKKEILNFINTIILSGNKQSNFESESKVLESLLFIILKDYSNSLPQHKDSEILCVIHSFLNNQSSNQYVITIIETCLVSTLQMIRENHKDYPDHRLQIFRIVKCLVKCHYETLLAIPQNDFRLIIDTIIFALSHVLVNILELGLEVLTMLLEQIVWDVSRAQIFYRHFLILILHHLLLLITDSAFRNSLGSHAEIFCLLIQKVESGFIFVPLDVTSADDATLLNIIKQQQTQIDASFVNNRNGHGDGETYSHNSLPNLASSDVIVSNIKFLNDSLTRLVTENFGHLSPSDITTFVNGLFAFDMNKKKMLHHLQDFLIDVSENRGNSFEDPFNAIKLEEMNEEQRKKTKVPFCDLSSLLHSTSSLFPNPPQTSNQLTATNQSLNQN
ncbi:MAG: Exportin-1 [Marteilia pararefringens]